MRDKNVAGILALFLGGLGVHRFYLGQIGWGILYLVFFWVSWVIGVIDAIVFLTMDKDDFDRQYNKNYYQRQSYRQDYDRQSYRRERADLRARRRENARPARPAYGNPVSTAARDYLEEGKKNFRDYDYESAIDSFEAAIKENPKDVAAHFNIACAYSLTENKDKAFYHLDRAVALGFDDWNRIKNHDALAFLRIQPEFLIFEQNGFRLGAPQLASPKEDLLSSQPAGGGLSRELLDQLNRLGELHEKGLLTEEEFVAQKRKLLG